MHIRLAWRRLLLRLRPLVGHNLQMWHTRSRYGGRYLGVSRVVGATGQLIYQLTYATTPPLLPRSHPPPVRAVDLERRLRHVQSGRSRRQPGRGRRQPGRGRMQLGLTSGWTRSLPDSAGSRKEHLHHLHQLHHLLHQDTGTLTMKISSTPSWIVMTPSSIRFLFIDCIL